MSDSLAKRVRRARARATQARWQSRQRHHAGGSWFRLRRVLADAARAWAIDEQGMSKLLAEGLAPEPVGGELHPEKVIVFAAPERIARIEAKRELALHLDADLLAARFIVLERFP